MPHIIESIVTQHAEEAAFLWLLRESTIVAPHYTLEDVAKHDDRIEAHVDGLRITGEPGWEILKTALGQEEAGEVFAASVIAFESGRQEWIDAVLEVGTTSPELSRGVISALGWLTFDQASGHLQKLLSHESPILQRIGIAALAIHREDPADALHKALSHDDLPLKARALKATGELGKTDLLPQITKQLTSKDIPCQFAAAWAAARFGVVPSLAVLQDLAITTPNLSARAGTMALRCMTLETALGWQRDLAGHPDFARLAVQGAGVIGDPFLIPWLIEQMEIPEVARVAGESFSMITGIDLAYDDLESEWPEDFEAGPTEDPEDENVEMDDDEDLPWPNPELLQKWWSTNKLNYQNKTRYLCGKPMAIDSLKSVLTTGYQRQRIAAAIELAIRQPNTPLFETRAPGWRQQRLLD